MTPSREDAALARALADRIGTTLLTLRSASDQRGSQLRSAGDRAAQEVVARVLGAERPADAVLSEEAADSPARLTARRVWIVDPLDGTREFGEPGRDDWAVHVALWDDGDLVAGAVALPAVGLTFATDTPPVLPPPGVRPARAPGASASAAVAGAPDPSRTRIVVSRGRAPSFAAGLARALDAVLLPLGSAGAKAASVWLGHADAYVHAGGQYEWDNAAPVAVARAAGLHASRLDGRPLTYNRPDPWSPELLICRPELAAAILARTAQHTTEVTPR